MMKKIDAAMNKYYTINGIEFNPFDDEEEEKAIAYAAAVLNMTVNDIIEYLDGAY
jgi:hypothetical protein